MGIDTNNCMNLTTRERLLQAATRLFADNGYRGASVRDICNLAGANPGAVSYHFGGKRQLYRAVLRRAAAGLADMGPVIADDTGERAPVSVLGALQRVLDRMQSDDAATRLLLRDLADGAPPSATATIRMPVARGGCSFLVWRRRSSCSPPRGRWWRAPSNSSSTSARRCSPSWCGAPSPPTTARGRLKVRTLNV